MNRLDCWLSLILVVTLGFLLGMLGFFLWDKMPAPVQPIAWSDAAQWIASPEQSYRFYARRTFYVNDTVRTAWLRLSADNDFILYVNGQRIASEVSVYDNSFGFNSLLSEARQNFNDSLKYSVKNRANYQQGNYRDWKLTTYVDLTPYLRPGKNAIALEIQKGQNNPRFVVEGAIYTVPDAPIDLTTGATSWKVSTLAENHQQLLWFDADFPDQNWSEAKAIGSVTEVTYSRLSQHLFDRALEGTWISGEESPRGEVWLRNSWQMPLSGKRAFIRFAGDGEYALLINGLLVNRFEASDRNLLRMYDVTNFLHKGVNTLAVRLARPLDPDWSGRQRGAVVLNKALGFFLDGWIETDRGDIVGAIATSNTWTALHNPVSGWAEGAGFGQPATLLQQPYFQEFQRLYEGDAYLLNYPHYLWRSSLWQLAGISCALIYTWFLGRFWLGRNGWWDSLGAGAGLLLPGTLFLIAIGLLKHRYAEAERGLLFVQQHSNSLILLGFVGIVILTLLWSQIGASQKNIVDKVLTSQTKHLNNNLASVSLTFPAWGLWLLVGAIAFISLSLTVGGMAPSQSPTAVLVGSGFAAMVGLALIWRPCLGNCKEYVKSIVRSRVVLSQSLLLFVIVAIGFGLRSYKLDFVSLDWDESISLDATRGILRTGAPEATAGIWYTRGPFFHYMLALWLHWIGDTAVNGRWLSVIWGTATLVLVFIFARQVTGKIWIALLVTAILAVDPFSIWYSRNIRFYQVLQFTSLLAFWSFNKGFIQRSGRFYQYLFFIALTLMLLSQEITITLLPSFLIGFLFLYRPFRLSADWPIVLSALMTCVIYAYNGIFFSIKCLTPWIGLSDTTDSFMKPHLSDVTGFMAVFFPGCSRMYTLYSLFFFLGCIYFIKRGNGKIVFLFSSLLINLILLTIMSFNVGLRYAYSIYPVFITLAIYSAICLAESLGGRFQFILQNLLPLKAVALGCILLLLVGNLELERLESGYQDAINIRNDRVFEYIKQHRQPGDVVISNFPPAAIASSVKLNYHLSPYNVLEFSNVYSHNGRVIDRGAGSVLISNIDQVKQILQAGNRIWLHAARDFRGDPEMVLYLKTLGKPVMETFNARLRLWQPEDGLLPRVPNEGKDLGAY